MYEQWNYGWECRNQDLLKKWYKKKRSGENPDPAVRKITCKGCGRVLRFW